MVNGKEREMKRILQAMMAFSLVLCFGLLGCQGNEAGQSSSGQAQEGVSAPDEATQSVIDAIDSIGEVALEKKDLIDSTLRAYGSLDAASKELVQNYDVLQAAVNSLEELEKAEAARAEEAKAFAVGETVESEDFRVALSDAYLSAVLESPDSSTYWESDDSTAFAVLEFDIEALNSEQIPVDSGAVSDVVATYNGNTYANWDYKYVVSQLWLSAKRTYFEANMPVHVYVYASLPASVVDGSVTVDMDIAGQEKRIVI